jgi:hypothetical protein
MDTSWSDSIKREISLHDEGKYAHYIDNLFQDTIQDLILIASPDNFPKYTMQIPNMTSLAILEIINLLRCDKPLFNKILNDIRNLHAYRYDVHIGANNYTKILFDYLKMNRELLERLNYVLDIEEKENKNLNLNEKK